MSDYEQLNHLKEYICHESKTKLKNRLYFILP